MNTHKLTAFAAILLSTISSALSQSPPQYSVLDLGTVSGVYSQAMGINNAGQVVGLDANNDGTGNGAFLYSGGTMTKLGTLGGSNRNTFASAINDAGQVVGYSVVLIPAPNPCDPNNPNYAGSFYCDPQQNPNAPDPNAPYFVEQGHAFLYSDGIMTDLGALPNAANGEASANGINNLGQVVGTSRSPFDPYYGSWSHGFLYSNGSMSDIGDLGGGSDTFPYGINKLGQIVGRSDVDFGTREHAFLYSGGTMNDLGTLGGYSSAAYGINDFGQIVGYSLTTAGQKHAFLYSNGTMTDLETLGGSNSAARAINSSGQVVGYSDQRVFLYSAGSMYNLNTLSGVRLSAVDSNGINDFGQIAATSESGHAVLLRPITSAAAGMPVSSTVASNASYTLVPPVTNSSAGSDNTNVALIGGTATNATTANITFTSSAPSGFQAASDVVNISGTGSDTIVLQMSYNEAQAISVFGTEADARLMWLDPTDNQWKLAVAGNTGGSPQFINRAYAPATDFQLGNYGVDIANNVVWAVINHNSYFAIGKFVPVVLNAVVQQPINRDGSSVFNAKRGVVPVKFTLTQNGSATCAMPAATIALTRTAGNTPGVVNESAYSSAADSGSNFRIDSCQYVYNLSSSALGAGTYRVDIKINSQVVGSSAFQLK